MYRSVRFLCAVPPIESRSILSRLCAAYANGRVGPEYWVIATRAVASFDKRGVAHALKGVSFRASLINAIERLLRDSPFDFRWDQHFSRLLSFCFAPCGKEALNHCDARGAVANFATERILLQMAVLARAPSANGSSIASLLLNSVEPCATYATEFNEQIERFVMPAYAADTPFVRLLVRKQISPASVYPEAFIDALFKHWVRSRHSSSRDLIDSIHALNEVTCVLRALSSLKRHNSSYKGLSIDTMKHAALGSADLLVPLLRLERIRPQQIKHREKPGFSVIRALPDFPRIKETTAALRAMDEIDAFGTTTSAFVAAATIAGALAVALHSAVLLEPFGRTMKVEASAALVKLITTIETGRSTRLEGTAAPPEEETQAARRSVERALRALRVALNGATPKHVADDSFEEVTVDMGDASTSFLPSKKPIEDRIINALLDEETTLALLAKLREAAREHGGGGGQEFADESADAEASPYADQARHLASSDSYQSRVSALLISATRREAVTSSQVWYRLARSVLNVSPHTTLSPTKVAYLCVALEAELIRRSKIGILHGGHLGLTLGILECMSRLPASRAVAAAVRRCSTLLLHTATSRYLPTGALDASTDPADHNLRVYAFCASSIARCHYSLRRQIDFRRLIEPALIDELVQGFELNLKRRFDVNAFGLCMYSVSRFGLTFADVAPIVYLAMQHVVEPPVARTEAIPGLTHPMPARVIQPDDVTPPKQRKWLNLGDLVALADGLNMLQCCDRSVLQWIIRLHGTPPPYTSQEMEHIVASQRELLSGNHNANVTAVGDQPLGSHNHELTRSSFDFGSARTPCGVITKSHRSRLYKFARRCCGGGEASTEQAASDAQQMLRHLRVIDFMPPTGAVEQRNSAVPLPSVEPPLIASLRAPISETAVSVPRGAPHAPNAPPRAPATPPSVNSDRVGRTPVERAQSQQIAQRSASSVLNHRWSTTSQPSTSSRDVALSASARRPTPAAVSGGRQPANRRAMADEKRAFFERSLRELTGKAPARADEPAATPVTVTEEVSPPPPRVLKVPRRARSSEAE